MKTFFPGFPPEGLKFLRRLKRNNNRDWFLEHKEIYEQQVKIPMTGLVLALGGEMGRFAPELNTDPKLAIYRIYRDIRFSRDKTPYKTNVGIHFGLEAPRDFDAPGYYLHLEPGSVFMGAGIWHPGADALRTIREAIVRDPRGWKQARRVGLSHDEVALKRPPRGFDPDHPLIEDIKRLSFTTGTEFSVRQACAPDFPARFEASCRRAAPLMRFLARATGLAFTFSEMPSPALM